MKRGFRKILSVILVLAMMCSLAACGSSSKDMDPNLGKYIGYQIDIMGWEPMDSVYDGGENYVELKSGGKGTFCLDGSSTKIKWTLDGENLTMTAEGEDCTGTLKDGMITTDFFGYDFTMTFLKEGVEAPADTATTTEAAEPETAGEVGYWQVSSYDDGETQMTGDEMQEYGIVYYMQLEEGGTGTMVTDESTPMEWGDGKMTFSSGAQMMTDYDHFIEIHGEMEDPENDDNSYDYFLYLRPWGMDWEDIRGGDTDEMPYTDMMPPSYDTWYVPLIDAGETSAPADIVLDDADTGDDTESESDSESSTSATAGTSVDGVYDTGEFNVTVPDGWAAFGVDDMWSDEEGAKDPTSLMIGKGATDEYDIYSKPYIEIKYYDKNTEMYVPGEDMYDDMKDISPVTLGNYKWKGFTGSFSGYKLTLIYTGKSDADQFQVTIWTETDGGKISFDDKDVKAIIGSITVD
ncbi:MAG: hypothetical protein GX685_12025 [Clostridiales bacterium]|nr:hypothetical protein [Clostridiales bacterium]